MWVYLEVILVFAIAGSNMIYLIVRVLRRNVLVWEISDYYQVQFGIEPSVETKNNIDFVESSFLVMGYFQVYCAPVFISTGFLTLDVLNSTA